MPSVVEMHLSHGLVTPDLNSSPSEIIWPLALWNIFFSSLSFASSLFPRRYSIMGVLQSSAAMTETYFSFFGLTEGSVISS